jgi:hypothetical protein
MGSDEKKQITEIRVLLISISSTAPIYCMLMKMVVELHTEQRRDESLWQHVLQEALATDERVRDSKFPAGLHAGEHVQGSRVAPESS